MARFLSRISSRRTTLLVALLSLTSNTLSSLLLHKLPDDSFPLAFHYGVYLHFANVLSIFGVIGAWRKNPLSILLFSTYLLLDTLLSSIPRILLLNLLSNSSSTLCAPTSCAPIAIPTSSQSPFVSSFPSLSPSSISPHILTTPRIAGFYDYVSRTGIGTGMGGTGGTSRVIEDDGPWSELACRRLISLAYVSLVVGVLAAMGLQVCAAFCVRDYARGLFEGERGLGVEAGLEAGERPGDEKTTEGKEHRPFIVLDAPLGMEGEV